MRAPNGTFEQRLQRRVLSQPDRNHQTVVSGKFLPDEYYGNQPDVCHNGTNEE